ncbi:hypothetical protein LWC34_05215 [Kibdelosporangium philippinense]|uniref:Uncharacterized protein n=1 Tax=Kibdelosporangium philippinense TaxID=211113 RepID=A0ABS8Z5E1_9PSEU|nr:hypothetical protein [Kibdelosporangium philippinense]MCE7002229.1 hypothetical protein [Kibdelosporangium philippinense]
MDDRHDRSASPRLRALVAATVLAATVIIMVGEWPEQNGERPVSRPAELLAEFTSGLRPDGPYRAPTSEERDIAELGFASLLAGLVPWFATGHLRSLGFSVEHGVDTATGRPYLAIVNEPGSERAWGMYMIDLSAAVRLAIEVPHPNSDLRTEQMGLELFRRIPGSILMVAGAHRDAADKAADVAHRKDSIFHIVATRFADRGLPQVQLHGFGDATLPGRDLVLSASIGRPGVIAEHTALRLERAGLVICLVWREECGRLSATRNAQGRTAAAFDSPYLHVEASRSVREDTERRTAVIDAITAEFLPR